MPIVCTIYFMLTQRSYSYSAKAFLFLASLFYYGWWNWNYLILILSSIVLNFGFGLLLLYSTMPRLKRFLLGLGITGNLGVLGYYKYRNFFAENFNSLFGTDIVIHKLALPLAISFFTFQQVAYLVDSYKGISKESNFLNYALFVSFFPQLIAGPIVHHKEMMPQFDDPTKKKVNYERVCLGLFVFSIGLFKKVALADTLMPWKTNLLKQQFLNFWEGWIVSFAVSYQFYFDFSGYCDMAIGLALILNIHIVDNFNSPFRATNNQEFWQRWHITLNRFFMNYLYIPLGGSKKGVNRTAINIFIIFLLGGLWHGASWNFVLWGLAHGIGVVICFYWGRTSYRLPSWLGWFLTFGLFIVTAPLFFGENMNGTLRLWQSMFNFSLSNMSLAALTENSFEVFFLLFLTVVVLWPMNSIKMRKNFQLNRKTAILTITLLFVSLMARSGFKEFLYFNF